MPDANGRKFFSAELQQMKAKGKPISGDLTDVLDAIKLLHRDVLDLGSAVREERVPPAAALPPPVERDESAELAGLREEIHILKACIDQTKVEIAALRPQDSSADRLAVVTDELDAIVDATENATQGILESAERIDGLADQLQQKGVDGYTVHVAEDIRDQVVKVFESCNFQDITGQRINKVVKTLQYIEERVNRMIDIWGKDSFAGLSLPEEVEASEEEKLLNGPALANQGISQEDIDKLFG